LSELEASAEDDSGGSGFSGVNKIENVKFYFLSFYIMYRNHQDIYTAMKYLPQQQPCKVALPQLSMNKRQI